MLSDSEAMLLGPGPAAARASDAAWAEYDLPTDPSALGEDNKWRRTGPSTLATPLWVDRSTSVGTQEGADDLDALDAAPTQTSSLILTEAVVAAKAAVDAVLLAEQIRERGEEEEEEEEVGVAGKEEEERSDPGTAAVVAELEAVEVGGGY